MHRKMGARVNPRLRRTWLPALPLHRGWGKSDGGAEESSESRFV